VTPVHRLALVAFLAYVALDLSCPLVQGAFSFEPEESVDAASRHRDRAGAPAVVPAVAVASAAPAIASSVGARRAPQRPALRAFHRARDHAGVLVDAPSLEDH
jgi:hypothetical protein